jgi:hypothetical protein
MDDILAHSSHLTGSEGSEYDLIISDGEQLSIPNQQEKIAAKLGFHPRLMGVDTADLFSVEDLIPTVQLPAQAMIMPTDKKQAQGLSRREMNRAKRKVLYIYIYIYIYRNFFS